jgi:hypothetical protein
MNPRNKFPVSEKRLAALWRLKRTIAFFVMTLSGALLVGLGVA